MKNYSEEIAEVTTQLQQVKRQWRMLLLANDQKVKEVFDNAFNVFREFEIKVSSSCASFHIKDEDRNKEVFSISFYERYSSDRRLELSYYTTSTQSEFELNRLIKLGEVAQVVRSNSERIMRDIVDVKKSDKQREDELYTIIDGYEKKIAEIRNAEYRNKKLLLELQLAGEGVEFEAPVYFQFKRNYTSRIVGLKILGLSKSGKSCLLQYTTVGGSVGKEDRVDFESAISQVLSQEKNIVQELLPA